MTFRHSGDLGDLIFFAAVVRGIEGNHSILLVDRNTERPYTAPLVSRSEIILPLLNEQGYIVDARCSEEQPDVDMTLFRNFHSSGTTLVSAQRSHFNHVTGKASVDVSDRQWLSAGDCSAFDGFSNRVIIARSPRYNNPGFPWPDIVKHYGERLIFVGLDKEHSSFQESFGSVDRLTPVNFLELAKAIHSSPLFIGNQSSPHAIAIGLGGDMISEVCLWQPDCIYKRTNIQYCYDGGCILPDVSGSGKLRIARKRSVDTNINKALCPPGLWQYPGAPSSGHYKGLLRIVSQLESCSEQEADELIVGFNVDRCPDFFRRKGTADYDLVLGSLHRAGIISGAP